MHLLALNPTHLSSLADPTLPSHVTIPRYHPNGSATTRPCTRNACRTSGCRSSAPWYDCSHRAASDTSSEALYSAPPPPLSPLAAALPRPASHAGCCACASREASAGPAAARPSACTQRQ